MPMFETFSKRRKKQERSGQADVYQYDSLPDPLRIQIVHIWRYVNKHLDKDAFSREVRKSNQLGDFIENLLARELGILNLQHAIYSSYDQCEHFLLTATDEEALDLVDLSFNIIDHNIARFGDQKIAQYAIEELNYRFREHGIGYEFVGGELVRIDSQYMHSEVVKNAIALLHDTGFQGASDEFLHAHEHYRHGRTKEAIADALKAFESTLKTICDLRGWTYSPGATAKPLIDTVLKNGVLPSYVESHFIGLRTTLESGLPTVRNKTSGHGQGSAPVNVPEHIAAYALHLAATNIVFLVESHKAMP